MAKNESKDKTQEKSVFKHNFIMSRKGTKKLLIEFDKDGRALLRIVGYVIMPAESFLSWRARRSMIKNVKNTMKKILIPDTKDAGQ